MTFSEAVKSGFEHYTKFDGRASRPAYWWWFLFVVLATGVADFIDFVVLDTTALSVIVGLGLFLPGLSVAIRRLHDTGRTGWWIFIILIPIVGFIVLLVFYLQASDAGENQYGPEPVAGVS